MRPAEVVGSYAVYAKELKHNIVGGKEYKTGKVGHFFRPRIEDSAGAWTWGNLNIDKGILSVTIPQEFLDTAVYPVRHATGLTFGYTSVGASNSNNYSLKQQYLMCGDPTNGETGKGVSISMFVRTSSGSGNVQAAVYDTSSPSNLISNAFTPSIGVSTTADWRTGNFASQPDFTNIPYYLVFIGDSGWYNTGYLYYDSVSTNEVMQSMGKTFNTWTATATIISYNTVYLKFSMYVTYTPPVTKIN